ncbi:DedA family protein [Plantactinospora veratri]|uniref:DedA family protein n=1 Tax=Plantactinospora veratri TaxID=1436122 RepID=A0ABU7S812_9ACTN
MDPAVGLVDRLTGLPPGWLYLAAGALLAAEVGVLAGILVPAAGTMLAIGLLARNGYLDLVTALVVCTVAAFAGDQLGYLQGRLAGTRLQAGRLARWIGVERWRRAEAMVVDRDGSAILRGRWLTFGRTLVARVAGAAGVPYRRFVLFDAIGVAVWVPGTVLLGYGIGVSYTGLTAVVGPVAGLVLVAAAVVLAGGWLHRRLRAGPSGYAAGPSRPAGTGRPAAPDRGGRQPRRGGSRSGPAVRALPQRLRSARFSPLRQPPRPTGPAGRRRVPGGREAPGRSDAGDGD